MASVNAGRLLAALRGKLAAAESGGDHINFQIYDDAGMLVAHTKLSRGWKRGAALGEPMASTIRRELRLRTAAELARLVDCPMSRLEYLSIASD